MPGVLSMNAPTWPWTMYSSATVLVRLWRLLGSGALVVPKSNRS